MPISRESYIAGLRAIASFYEDHPEVRLPVSSRAEREDFTNYFNSGKEYFPIAARALKPFQKVYPREGSALNEIFIEREVAPGIFLRFHTRRSDICRKVSRVIAAHTVEVPEAIVEEWECGESLMDLGEESAPEAPDQADVDNPIDQRRSAEEQLARVKDGAGTLSDLRDLILDGYVELNPPARPTLLQAGAERLTASTGIQFSAGDPLPLLIDEEPAAE